MGTPWVRDVPVALLLVLHLVGVGCSASGISTNDGPLVNAKDVMVVGKAACSDCSGENLHGGVSFKGLQVAIVCKSLSGKYQAQGVSAFDKSGSFRVSLPRSVLNPAGRLKHECFAQLFDPSKSSPCPTDADPRHFKIVPHQQASNADANLHLFTTATHTLHFSRSACVSDTFLWPFPKHPFNPWFKPPLFPKYGPVHKRRHRKYRRCSHREHKKGHHKRCPCKHQRRSHGRYHHRQSHRRHHHRYHGHWESKRPSQPVVPEYPPVFNKPWPTPNQPPVRTFPPVFTKPPMT